MIEPLKHRVLIQRDPAKTKTESGFIIPEEAQRKQNTGTILAVGKTADSNLKIGQRVMFGINDGFQVSPEHCEGLKECWMIADNQVRLIFNA